MIFRFILGLSLAVSFQFCNLSESYTEHSSDVSDTLTFDVEADQRSTSVVIRCDATISTQRLNVVMELASFKPIVIQPELSELITPEGNRSTPVRTEKRRSPGIDGQQLITLTFEPVHSRDLFQRTGLRGDIASEYKFLIRYLQDGRMNEKQMTLSASAKYEQSLKKFGLKSNTKPYALAMNEKFVSDQKVHLSGMTPDRPEPSIHISGDEILMNGLWLKIRAYHRSDTLFTTVRFVNQSLMGIRVDLDEILLTNDHKIIKPQLGAERSIDILNGRRAQVELKFPTDVSENFMFDLSGIKAAGDRVVFSRPLLLKLTALFPEDYE